MNEQFPPFRLPRPEFAERRSDASRFVPLPPEVVARRQEIARELGAKIEAMSTSLRGMTEEQRKAVFVKLEHDGKIELSGTNLRAIRKSDNVTLAVPKADNLKWTPKSRPLNPIS